MPEKFSPTIPNIEVTAVPYIVTIPQNRKIKSLFLRSFSEYNGRNLPSSNPFQNRKVINITPIIITVINAINIVKSLSLLEKTE
ncbi:MAG: hypothetical protein K2J32_14145 [Ruminococcus sp.]|nr:hypothetical protein [Ruminococcus sp.]